ncbi:MAG: FAD binding domain-containing protein [Thermoleophilia bacterium]
MKPPPLDYARPETVEEAVATLAEHGDEAKVLAGGQSLMPLLAMRFARPAVLVDVNRVAGLDAIAEADGTLRVGAVVRQNDLAASALARRAVPLATRAIPWIGHFVTRNRGTVGGSIAHADARGELPLALAALDGRAIVASTRGRRELTAGELFVTHFTTSLEPDELLVETVWPVAGPGWGFAFEELAQRAGDYALGMVAVALRADGGRVAGARVAVGAAVDRPARLAAAEAALAGRAVDDEASREAGAAAAAAVDPPDDLHASGRYRRHLVGLLVERAVLAAWREAAA